MVEPIDEVAIQNLQTYKEKKFVDISKEDLELGMSTVIVTVMSVKSFFLTKCGSMFFGR